MELILESAANGSKSFFNQLAESLKMSNSKIQKLIFPDIYITNIDLDLYMGSSVYEFATKRISGILETRKNKFLLFQQQFLSSLQSMSLAPSFFDSHSKPEFIHFLIDKKEFISNSADEPPPA